MLGRKRLMKQIYAPFAEENANRNIHPFRKIIPLTLKGLQCMMVDKKHLKTSNSYRFGVEYESFNLVNRHSSKCKQLQL